MNILVPRRHPFIPQKETINPSTRMPYFSAYRIEISLLYFFPCHFSFSNLSGIFVNVDPSCCGVFFYFYLFDGASRFASLNSLRGQKGCTRGFFCPCADHGLYSSLNFGAKQAMQSVPRRMQPGRHISARRERWQRYCWNCNKRNFHDDFDSLFGNFWKWQEMIDLRQSVFRGCCNEKMVSKKNCEGKHNNYHVSKLRTSFRKIETGLSRMTFYLYIAVGHGLFRFDTRHIFSSKHTCSKETKS